MAKKDQQELSKFRWFVKFYWPSNEDGSVDISKAWKSLLSLDRFFRKYQKENFKNEESDFIIKISGVNKNCSELLLDIVEMVKNLAPIGTYAISAGYILDKVWVTEFGKQFFGTLGEQLALKLFAKGKEVKKEKEIIKEQIVFVQLANAQWDKKIVTKQEWENFMKLSPYLDGFAQLEKWKEERLVVGYKNSNWEEKITGEITYQDKEFFGTYVPASMEDRMNDPVDWTKGKKEKIIGRFVDFYWLAHKYHFAFQARKNQEEIGKQKILCVVEESEISRLLDYLKPEFDKNICIYGQAIRDWEDKVDKIKIEWVNEDEDFDPKQISL